MGNRYAYNMQTLYNEDAVSYYLLGAFMTDGNVSKDGKIVSIHSNDKDWIDLICSFICPNKTKPFNGNTYCAVFNCKRLADWLISHECTPAKSLTLQYPLNNPMQYLVDFIRGVWDGDGTLVFTRRLRNKQGRIPFMETTRAGYLSTGSEDFANGILYALQSLGIDCFISVIDRIGRKAKKRNGKYITTRNLEYRVVIRNGEAVHKFCKLVYTNTSLAMPRKLAIAQAIIEDWERPIVCVDCGINIPNIGKFNRSKRSCDECKIVHIRRVRVEYKQRTATRQ